MVGSTPTINKEYDQYRDAFLRVTGYEVIRFWNNEVMSNLDGVLEALILALSHEERGIKQGDKVV